MSYIKTLRNKIFILFLIFLTSFCLKGFAQDPNFSQFYNNPIYYNPAFAGYNDRFNELRSNDPEWTQVLRTNYRKFKFNVRDKGFHSLSVSYDAGYSPANTNHSNSIGFGLLALQTQEGYFRTQTIGMVLSSGIRIAKYQKIRFGLTASSMQKSLLDPDDLIFSSQLDPVRGNIYGSTNELPSRLNFLNSIDFDAGMVYTLGFGNTSDPINNLILGFSAHHLYSTASYTIDDNSKNKMPIRYVLQANYNCFLARTRGFQQYNRLSFAGIYENQLKFNTTTLGLNYYTSPMVFGLWFRNIISEKSDYSAIVEFGYDLLKRSDSRFLVKTVFNYDFTLNNRRYTYGDSMGISIIIKQNYLYE